MTKVWQISKEISLAEESLANSFRITSMYVRIILADFWQIKFAKIVQFAEFTKLWSHPTFVIKFYGIHRLVCNYAQRQL